MPVNRLLKLKTLSNLYTEGEIACNIHLSGKACGEYNIVGKVIQENGDVQCKSCPAVYSSTEAYKCNYIL
jgi:hypothetical protein